MELVGFMEIYRCWILFGSKEGRMGGLEMLTLDDSTGSRTFKPLCDEGGIAPITRRRI